MNNTLNDVSAALEEIRLTCPFNQFAGYLQEDQPNIPTDSRLGGDCIEMTTRLRRLLEQIIDAEQISHVRCNENSFHVFTIVVIDGKQYFLDPFTQQKKPILIRTNVITKAPAFPTVGKKSYTTVLDYCKVRKEHTICRVKATGIYDQNSAGIVGRFKLDDLDTVDISTYNPVARLHGKHNVIFRTALQNGGNITIRYPDYAESFSDTSIQASTDAFHSNIKYEHLFMPALEQAAVQIGLTPADIIAHIQKATTIINYKRKSRRQ